MALKDSVTDVSVHLQLINIPIQFSNTLLLLQHCLTAYTRSTEPRCVEVLSGSVPSLWPDSEGGWLGGGRTNNYAKTMRLARDFSLPPITTP